MGGVTETVIRNVYASLALVMVLLLTFFAFISSTTRDFRQVSRAAPVGSIPTPAPLNQTSGIATCPPTSPTLLTGAPVVGGTNELYYLMQAGGGLSNQRANMLQGLLMAKNLGIRKVILSESILKLTNIQIEMRRRHRFKAPYDYITLFKGPVSPMYAGDISELFDIQQLRSVAAKMGLELVPRGHGFGWSTSPVVFAAHLVVDTKPPKTWDQVFATRLSVSIGSSTEPPRPVMVSSNMHYRLMHNIRECRTLPNCLELAKAFAPPPLILSTFVDPILQKLGSDYLAVHYRAFACDKGPQGIARVAPLLDRLVKEGKLSGLPKKIYLSTSRPQEEFHLLREAGYEVISKQTVNPDFNVWSYPFEVMAHVDFEICRRATNFVTMSDMTTSTFAIFLELHRELDGQSAAIYSGKNCF